MHSECSLHPVAHLRVTSGFLDGVLASLKLSLSAAWADDEPDAAEDDAEGEDDH